MTWWHTLRRFIWRSWYYFRVGYGTYLALLLGYSSNIVVLYKLAVVDNRYLTGIFTSLAVFTILGLLVSVPTAILIGIFHIRRSGAFAAEASLSTESNPYMYKLVPGKEREVLFPLLILTAKGLAKVMREQNALSPQEKEEFDRVLAKADRLIEGQVVGHPRRQGP